MLKAARLLSLILLSATAQAAVAQETPAREPRSRDSVYNRRNAENAVQVYLMRIALFRGMGNDYKNPWYFKCENRVDIYCFGSTNGGSPFGHPRFTNPVEFLTSPMFVPRMDRRQYDAMFRYMMINLDAYQKKVPGDRWILGQRVHHVMNRGEIERAQKIARDCKADRWWCAALVGYTSYYLNQFQRADSAFAVTLATLPDSSRCVWEGIEDLLHGDEDRSWYTRLSCAERRELTPTIWWLSDPLYLTPGNERLAAHYQREIARQLFIQTADAQPPAQVAIRRGARKLDFGTALLAPAPNDRFMWQSGALSSLLRSLGVPSFTIGNAVGMPDDEVLLQYKQPTYHFLPTVAAMRDPLRATAASWNLDDPQAMERYHPAFGSFTTLDHQIAWFKRDTMARIVAAVDVAGNKLLGGAQRRQLYTTALFLTRGPQDLRTYRDTIPGRRSTFYSRVPAESALVSVESMVAGIGAGRIRFASGPTPMPAQRIQLSDLLLLDSADSLPTNLDVAARRARPNTTLAANAPLGMFWEVYGLSRGDTVSYTLTAVAGARSVITNIGRFVGVLGAEQNPSVQWTEPVETGGAISGKNMALDISTLSRGSYTLVLEVAVKGQEVVRLSRAITIVAAVP